jgi:acyl carrier protein
VNIDEARGVLSKAIEKATGKVVDTSSDASFASLKLDSLSMMEITMDVEDQTGIGVDLADLHPGSTFDDFCRLLVERVR